MVAMVTSNQLSLYLAAECARLIGGRHCSSSDVNYLACVGLTTHAISCDVCQIHVRSSVFVNVHVPFCVIRVLSDTGCNYPNAKCNCS